MDNRFILEGMLLTIERYGYRTWAREINPLGKRTSIGKRVIKREELVEERSRREGRNPILSSHLRNITSR